MRPSKDSTAGLALLFALAGLFAPGSDASVAAAPFAATQPPTRSAGTNATLHGMATPNGDAATAWFEWGTTVGYGRTTSPVAVGAGSKVVRVSVGITELIPRQVHHCRLVVSNVAGVAFGSDQPFIVGGDVVAWGDNSSGQTEVPGALRTAVAVAAGAAHSLALRNDGTLVGWGANFDGQATVPAGLNDLVAIAGGRLHSLALRRDGTVVAWGWNVSGQTDVPAGISNAVAIAAGGYHSLALRSDGTVVGWGATTVPAGLSNVVAVAASENHSLALRAGGTVVAWGANDFGATNVPVGLRQVVAIAAGEYLSLALRSDGTVVAWGYNLYGQATVPAGLSNVAAIAGGGFHSLALRGDGLVVAWGDNRAGQTTVPSSLSNVAALVGGYSHGLALRPNAAPLAIAQTFYGTANSDLVLTLSGSDLDGERLSYRITALPGAGTLYQYIGGARGLAITAPNTEVSDGAGQVIFAPAPDGFGDPYASFSFVANDTVADSPPAVVTLRIRSQLIMNHIVSNTNDGGAGSLRAAVLDALPGDTISFSITGTITLSNGELFVARDLAIMGPGVTNLTISGKGASRVFEIGSTVTASISDLTISDGVAQGAAGTNNVSGPGGDGEPGLGGGILNRGSLTLANCALTFNRAFGGPAGSGYPSGGGGKAEGGGIFNGGSLTIRNSTFLGNGVVGGPGAGAPASWSGVGGNGSGGAVCNTNILIVLQSTFSSNSVTGGNGFARGFFTSGDGGAGGSADGGAICNRRTTALLLSSFFGNLAQGGAGGSGGPGQGHSTGGGPGGHGGVGGFGRGGAITSDSGTVTMTNTTFAANRAQGGPGGAGGEGGATGCFTGSYPGQGGNGGRGGDGTGGGIYHSGTSLRLFSITCSSNTASGGLGGVGGLGGTTPGLGCNPPKPPRGWSGSYGTAGEGWAGGLHTPIGSTTMQNTILAANTASLTSLDLAGTVTSQGFNLIGVTNDSSGWIASDLKGNFAAPLDPKLGPLQDNGGPTFAMALLPGSPAIDHGSSNGLTTDQRGRFRPLDDPAIPNATSGDGSDIGAFELQSPAPVLTELVRNGSDVLLSFLTEVGQHYRVERTDVLAPATWSIVADNLPGSGSILRVVDHGGAVQPLRFYRGRTLP